MFVNMVLEDVTEYEITPEGKKVGAGHSLGRRLCGHTMAVAAVVEPLIASLPDTYAANASFHALLS